MLLDRFSYYFNVEGGEGGIYSLTFKFVPDTASSKHVKKDFEQLESLLDLQFLTGEHIINGEKIPTLSDSPAGMETGFKYKGRCRDSLYSTSKIFIDVFSSALLLDKLFKIKPVKPSMGYFTTLSASLRCHINKGNMNQISPALELNIQAGHNLNLSMFDALLTLPGITIGTNAETDMKNLRQMLVIGRQIDPKHYLESKV